MGVFIAILILFVWAGHLAYSLLFVELDLTNPWMYLHIIVQGYLYTGLFITAHDAMHGNIHPSKQVNTVLGTISVALFAGMSYKRLLKNHKLHHLHPATENDPDFYVKSQNFWVWLVVFFVRYLTVFQIVIMAVKYNLMVHVFNLEPISVWVFWALAVVLGSLQLFGVGVYWPHKLPHTHDMGIHKARTQPKNHLWAMVSCYFFGYHLEHHNNPRIAWWQLFKSKP